MHKVFLWLLVGCLASLVHLTSCDDGGDGDADADADGDGDGDGDGGVLGAFERLELSRTSGEGYCPTPGTLHEIWVEPTSTGDQYAYGGASFDEGDPEVDECLTTVGDVCVISVPFDDAALSPSQSQELDALVSALPSGPCETDPACDPCLIERFDIDGRAESISGCLVSDSPCTTPFGALITFLDALVP